jgi:hypothetical protein
MGLPVLRSTSLLHACRRHYPGGTEWVLMSLLPHSTAAFPGKLTGRLPHLVTFEACSAFTRVSACMFAGSPELTRYIRGFDGFVTSSTAPIAAGWSDPSPGGTRTHWMSPPLHGAQFSDTTPSVFSREGTA